MANTKGTTAGIDKQNSGRLIFEEFVPPSAWTEESACHHLLIDLPGFKREELKLQVENQSHIVVSGERQVKDNKYMRFEQKFLLPGNSDIGKITGKIEGEILYVAVPKKVRGESKVQEYESHDGGEEEYNIPREPAAAPSIDTDLDKDNTKNNDLDDGGYVNDDEKLTSQNEVFHEAIGDGWREIRRELLADAVIKLRKNKGIVITAVLAFSLGVFVSQKFQSNGE